MMEIGTEVYVRRCDIICVRKYSENNDMTDIYKAWGEGRVIEILGTIRRSIVFMEDGRIYITPVSDVTIHKRLAAADKSTVFDGHEKRRR